MTTSDPHSAAALTTVIADFLLLWTLIVISAIAVRCLRRPLLWMLLWPYHLYRRRHPRRSRMRVQQRPPLIVPPPENSKDPRDNAWLS